MFLVLATAAEVAGTAGVKAYEGFGRLGPSALTVLGYALAFDFLSQSLKYFPLGVAYAIWSGLGTVDSVLLGLLIWKEILGPVHVFAIALIVVGVVVLNFAPATEQGATNRLIHQSAWKGAFSEVRTSVLHGSSGNLPEDPSASVLRVGVNTTVRYPCFEIRPSVYDGEAHTYVKVSPRVFASSIRQALSACYPFICGETGDE